MIGWGELQVVVKWERGGSMCHEVVWLFVLGVLQGRMSLVE